MRWGSVVVTRRRLAGVIVALTMTFSVWSFVYMGSRECGVAVRPFSKGWFACVGNNCLQVGYASTRFNQYDTSVLFLPWADGLTSDPDLALYLHSHAWRTEWITAWRPFRAQAYDANPCGNYLVIPLWPLMPISFAIGSFMLAGAMQRRRIRRDACERCGYPIDVASARGQAHRCPECGDWTSVSRLESPRHQADDLAKL